MKAHEEIKKVLDCRVALADGRCKGFYCDKCERNVPGYSLANATKDALAYIQQLEATNAELLTKVEQLEKKCHQLERERDAAVADMTEIVYNCGDLVCQFCGHRDEHRCTEICGFAFHGFEWRGVKEE